ncbi:conserved hypothetical protein [Alteromonas infernus]
MANIEVVINTYTVAIVSTQAPVWPMSFKYSNVASRGLKKKVENDEQILQQILEDK